VWLTGQTCRAFTRDQITPHLDDCHCSVEVRVSFQEKAPRKTAENTVKPSNGGVGSVIANHRGGVESSVVITTLIYSVRNAAVTAMS